MMLQCNVISHWLSPYPAWSLMFSTAAPGSLKPVIMLRNSLLLGLKQTPVRGYFCNMINLLSPRWSRGITYCCLDDPEVEECFQTALLNISLDQNNQISKKNQWFFSSLVYISIGPGSGYKKNINEMQLWYHSENDLLQNMNEDKLEWFSTLIILLICKPRVQSTHKYGDRGGSATCGELS